MNTFWKWIIRTGSFFGLMFIMLFATDQIVVSPLESIIIFLIGTVSLGTFMYLVEDKYFPFRRKQVLKKIVLIFEAKPISDCQAKFKVDKYDITVDIDFILSLNKYAANGEVVSFHISRNQLKHEKLNRPLSQIEEHLNGKPTFRIYQTNSMGLKLAKKRIDEKLK